MEQKIPTELGIDLPLSTIIQQAEFYRKFIKALDDTARKLNITPSLGSEKTLQKIEEKISEYAKAEKKFIEYVSEKASEEYPELSRTVAENDFVWELVDETPEGVRDIVEAMADRFYDWRA